MKKIQATIYAVLIIVLAIGLLAGCGSAPPEPAPSEAEVSEAAVAAEEPATDTPQPPTATPTDTPAPTNTPTNTPEPEAEDAVAPAEVLTDTVESDGQTGASIAATEPQTETEVAVVEPADDGQAGDLPPLVLLRPGDGEVFPDISGETEIRLAWEPVKEPLAANELYLLTVRYQNAGQTETDYAWTQETSWAVNEHAYLRDVADDGLYFWSVQLMRRTNADGVPEGPALSQPSPERVFVWFTMDLDDTGGAVGDIPTVVPGPVIDDTQDSQDDDDDDGGDSGGDDNSDDGGGGVGYP